MGAAALIQVGAPPSPRGIASDAWRRFPLAKRRLITEGPTDGGGLAIFETLLIAAAEARRAGLSQEEAEILCRTIPFDASEPAKLARKHRELPRIVLMAYKPRDGEPILTGCPRDPAHSGNPHTSRLRNRFEPYCDDECARSCRILRASTDASAVISASPFAPVYASSLWIEGAKLGLGFIGRAVYERLVIRVLADDTHTAPASQRYLAAKLGDRAAVSTVAAKLRRMQRLGLTTLLDKRTGLRQVHILTAEQVRELEENYGTLALAERRATARRRESDEYAEWIAEEATRIANWTLNRTRDRSARLRRAS